MDPLATTSSGRGILSSIMAAGSVSTALKTEQARPTQTAFANLDLNHGSLANEIQNTQLAQKRPAQNIHAGQLSRSTT